MRKWVWTIGCFIVILALSGCKSEETRTQSSEENHGNTAEEAFGSVGGGQAFEDYLGADLSVYRALVDGIKEQAKQVPASSDSEKNGFILEWIRISPYGFLLTDIQLADKNFQLTYAYEKEVQDSYRKMMEEDLEKMKAEIPTDANELETVLTAYRYYASRFQPASAWNQTEQPDGIPFFQALETGEGTSLSYAQGCQFAWNELGIDAYLLKSQENGAEVRWCVAAKLGDFYYYFHPALENGSDGGFGLQYFASSEARMQESYEPAVSGPYSSLDIKNSYGDDRYDFMKTIVSWEFEVGEEHTLRLVDLDGRESLFHTDTGVWDQAEEKESLSDSLDQMTPIFDSIIRILLEDEESVYDPSNLEFVGDVLYLATVNYGYMLPGVSYEEEGSVQIPKIALQQIYSACFDGSAELPDLNGKSGFTYDASAEVYRVPLSDMGDGWVHLEHFEESEGGVRVLVTFMEEETVFGTYQFICEKNAFTAEDSNAVYRYTVKSVERK
ncbi:hypothetical protein [Hominifimenecus sp. rT4P-3]|uniref:hypothetical protein n=1 Tax=Hominifimenecus sp. rT4P-3 TaxID=3242979 RepID=UPI003DA2D448